jgi:hypothetical protein
MTDMTVGHEESSLSHFRNAAAVLSAGIHCDALAHIAVRADDKSRQAASKVD